MSIGSVFIDGLGLMGSSLAAALSADGVPVWCHHRRKDVAREAERRGWGRFADDLDAAANADLAVVGVPVAVIPERVRAIAERAPRVVITDVGSTKAPCCRALEDLAAAGRFVGSHPMCGSHHQGLDHADADLYRGARVVVTPHADCPEAAVAAVEALWRQVGGEPLRMAPAAHDDAVAEASHLPHVLAAQAARLLGEAGLPLAASGFRDTTRVAAGSAALWRDILLENREAVRREIGRAQADLARLGEALAAADGEAVQAWLDGAVTARRRFDERR